MLELAQALYTSTLMPEGSRQHAHTSGIKGRHVLATALCRVVLNALCQDTNHLRRRFWRGLDYQHVDRMFVPVGARAFRKPFSVGGFGRARICGVPLQSALKYVWSAISPQTAGRLLTGFIVRLGRSGGASFDATHLRCTASQPSGLHRTWDAPVGSLRIRSAAQQTFGHLHLESCYSEEHAEAEWGPDFSCAYNVVGNSVSSPRPSWVQTFLVRPAREAFSIVSAVYGSGRRPFRERGYSVVARRARYIVVSALGGDSLAPFSVGCFCGLIRGPRTEDRRAASPCFMANSMPEWRRLTAQVVERLRLVGRPPLPMVVAVGL